MAKPRTSSHSWIAPHGLRAKLACACLLMSFVPLTMLILVAGWYAFPAVREAYQLDRVFPLIALPEESTWWLVVLIVLTALVAWLGTVYLATKVVVPVIEISRTADDLVGDTATRTESSDRDELRQLTASLQALARRLHPLPDLPTVAGTNAPKLPGIEDSSLNLSGLLQVGELITRRAELPVVLDRILDQAHDNDTTFSFLIVAVGPERLVAHRRGRGIDMGLLADWDGKVDRPTVIDLVHAAGAAQRVWTQLGQMPLILQPVSLRRGIVGVLGFGTRRSCVWTPETIEMTAILARCAGLAIEHELLVQTARELSVRDELTGVYNETYMRQRLQEEIRRAVIYQRPCAYAVFAIEHLEDFRQRYGESDAEQLLKRVAQLVQQSISEVDRVSRVSGSQLAVLLPERSKREAMEIVEHIRRQVAGILAEVRLLPEPLAIISGVSENPLDGNMAEDLMNRAVLAMRQPPAGSPRM